MKLGKGGIKAIVVFVAFSITVGIVYQFVKPKRVLPVINPAMFGTTELVDSTMLSINKGHTISDFTLLNQYGDTVGLEVTDGKVVVVDFFFTTCGSICPKMSRQMKRVSEAYGDEIIILSHTVLPEVDSVQTLYNYAVENNYISDNWLFLTGAKEELYRLARKSYFVVIDEPSPEGPDFIHTENFVLVDKRKRIRGKQDGTQISYYDGTNSEEVDQLIEDIQILLEEGKE